MCTLLIYFPHKEVFFSIMWLCILLTFGLMFVQSEMKFLEGPDTVALKQHFGKKILELEDEKRAVQVNWKPLNFDILIGEK